MVFHRAVDGFLDHAGAGNAHVDHHIGLAHAEVRARHEGHVLRNVGEHHQLGAAEAVTVAGGFGDIKDALAEQGHGIHIDAGARRGHVDGGADAVRGGEGFRQGIDKIALAGRDAFFHQRAEAAEEVDARVLGGFVEHLASPHHLIAGEGRAHHPDGADADALVDDGDAELVAHFVAGGDEFGGVFGDLGAHPVGEHVEIVAGAVEKADAERHGTHIEVFVAQHVQGAEDFTICKHGNFLREVCFDTDGTCPPP